MYKLCLNIANFSKTDSEYNAKQIIGKNRNGINNTLDNIKVREVKLTKIIVIVDDDVFDSFDASDEDAGENEKKYLEEYFKEYLGYEVSVEIIKKSEFVGSENGPSKDDLDKFCKDKYNVLIFFSSNMYSPQDGEKPYCVVTVKDSSKKDPLTDYIYKGQGKFIIGDQWYSNIQIPVKNFELSLAIVKDRNGTRQIWCSACRQYLIDEAKRSDIKEVLKSKDLFYTVKKEGRKYVLTIFDKNKKKIVDIFLELRKEDAQKQKDLPQQVKENKKIGIKDAQKQKVTKKVVTNRKEGIRTSRSVDISEQKTVLISSDDVNKNQTSGNKPSSSFITKNNIQGSSKTILSRDIDNNEVDTKIEETISSNLDKFFEFFIEEVFYLLPKDSEEFFPGEVYKFGINAYTGQPSLHIPCITFEVSRDSIKYEKSFSEDILMVYRIDPFGNVDLSENDKGQILLQTIKEGEYRYDFWINNKFIISFGDLSGLSKILKEKIDGFAFIVRYKSVKKKKINYSKIISIGRHAFCSIQLRSRPSLNDQEFVFYDINSSRFHALLDFENSKLCCMSSNFPVVLIKNGEYITIERGENNLVKRLTNLYDNESVNREVERLYNQGELNCSVIEKDKENIFVSGNTLFFLNFTDDLYKKFRFDPIQNREKDIPLQEIWRVGKDIQKEEVKIKNKVKNMSEKDLEPEEEKPLEGDKEIQEENSERKDGLLDEQKKRVEKKERNFSEKEQDKKIDIVTGDVFKISHYSQVEAKASFKLKFIGWWVKEEDKKEKIGNLKSCKFIVPVCRDEEDEPKFSIPLSWFEKKEIFRHGDVTITKNTDTDLVPFQKGFRLTFNSENDCADYYVINGVEQNLSLPFNEEIILKVKLEENVLFIDLNFLNKKLSTNCFVGTISEDKIKWLSFNEKAEDLFGQKLIRIKENEFLAIFNRIYQLIKL